MNKLYNGTSAYSLDEYENYARTAKENKQKRSIQRKRETVVFCRFLIISVISIFCVASSLVYTNVMMIRASSEANRLKDKLALLTEQNKQTEMDINKKLDMKVVEERAINELGMQRPDNSQIIYIDVKQNTYTEVMNNNKNSERILTSVKDAIEGMVEYFR